MALHEEPRFERAPFILPTEVLNLALGRHKRDLKENSWLYCGYAPLSLTGGVPAPLADVDLTVDNAFRLGPFHGFERLPVVVTSGLRSSRFAPVLFWEVVHALAPGGLWIDLDETARCAGTSLTPTDVFGREYFNDCLWPQSRHEHGRFVVQALRKVRSTWLAQTIHEVGWSFGLLASGDPTKLAASISAILSLDLPTLEVIVAGAPADSSVHDSRVRFIETDRQEPRGWSTRARNLLADAARFDNLCLLNDEIVVTPAWAKALKAYGPCYGVLTFPQVYYADHQRRFALRVPDYRILHQRNDLSAALESNVYDSSRLVHAAYDDFGQSAVCSDRLYITRRSLWSRVQQDETLCDGEWADVSFGLHCQRKGIPHRVNALLTVESTTIPPMQLTRIAEMRVPDRPERNRVHVTPAQRTAAQREPEIFKPLMPRSRCEYYRSVIDRFNAITGLRPDQRLTLDTVTDARGLSDFWRVVERHVTSMGLASRDEIAQVCFFLSEVVYRWTPAELLAQVRAREHALVEGVPLAPFKTVVGWGAGREFVATHGLLPRRLAFLVDGDQTRWGSMVDGVHVKPPAVLKDLDPATTAIVVLAAAVEEVVLAVQALGAFPVFPITEVVREHHFAPIADLVTHFEEVEQYFPVLFEDSMSIGAAA